jgi:hypothetical protein
MDKLFLENNIKKIIVEEDHLGTLYYRFFDIKLSITKYLKKQEFLKLYKERIFYNRRYFYEEIEKRNKYHAIEFLRDLGSDSLYEFLDVYFNYFDIFFITRKDFEKKIDEISKGFEFERSFLKDDEFNKILLEELNF